MELHNLESQIVDGVQSLLKLAKTCTWNKVSNDCRFILSEIKNSDENFFKQSRSITKKNNKKIAQNLVDVLPELLSFYDDIYDINLYVHKASKKITIVDIRYYLKTSLPEECRNTIQKNAPMLHCKIQMPVGAYGTGKKFNINWQYHFFRNWLDEVIP